MRFAYFPGCVAEDSCKELDTSTIAVAKELGIDLVKLEDATCCGAGYVQEANHDLSLALNARTFVMAERLGLDIMTVCGTCQLYLAKTNKELREDPISLEKTNKALSKIGMNYQGKVKIKHFLQVLTEDYGLEKLKGKVRKRLEDLSIAPFYGCHILRPPEIHNFDDAERPKSFERLIEALGGKAVDYEGRTKCCGFHVLMVEEDLSLKMAGAYLLEAKEKGAQVMATPCPLCHLVLDAYQGRAGKLLGRKIDLPILHLPQLVGLALGLDGKKLKLSKHMVSAKKIALGR